MFETCLGKLLRFVRELPLVPALFTYKQEQMMWVYLLNLNKCGCFHTHESYTSYDRVTMTNGLCDWYET